jgi:L-alanine-DL-glutamate epimerase-like enolase superfamily enzyme
MKITTVHATWVHVPIPPERQHTSDFGKIASFDSVIVKIDTNAGLVGPLLHELVHEKFPVIDGRLEIPDRPGLGITVDEDFVRRHARP